MNRIVSHYRLEKELGRGGGGTVYKAYDLTLNRDVVVKLLAPDLTADRESRARFLREAQLASSLDHPNICTIYEIGQTEDQHFIAMQYVPGQTLSRLLDGRPLSLDSLLSIGLQVADALATAHAHHIVHRDIKAANIIVTPRGQAKVLDFGLAKIVSEKRSPSDVELTRMGASLGTPSYMSPEQARGERVDHRSDIFSFGVVLYEMATGQSPFKRRTPIETMNAVINERHRPVSELNKSIPPPLVAIIDRMLAKAPAERYQSMQQVVEELRAVAQTYGRSVGIPDGVSVPYVVPQRQSALGGVGRWVKRFLNRESRSGATSSRMGRSGLRVTQAAADQLPEPTIETTQAAVTFMHTAPSIIVLPFVNMSADQENEYFCDGMTEELIDALAKIDGLRVVSRSSSFQYKGVAHNIRELAEQLNVTHVLEGSVRQSGSRIRITAQLINAADGYHLWSEKYDREMADVFSVQDEIAGKIVEQLKLKLTTEQATQLMKPSTHNLEAYTLYLKGRFYWNKRTEEGLRKGIECFQSAIATDPNYALAYAGLADCYNILAITGADPSSDAFRQAKAAALQALALDERLAEAHASLALAKTFYDWDWPGAEQGFRQAIQYNPNYPTAHQWYAEYLSAMSRFDEALTEIKRALELDPLSLMIITAVGLVFYYGRQYDQAIEPLRRVLEMDPNFPPALRVLGWAYEQKGMMEEAVGQYQRAVSASGGNVSMLADLGRAYGLIGWQDKAQQALDELQQIAHRCYVSPYEFALIYAGLDDKDRALEKLYEAAEERYWLMVNLNAHATWDGLRDEPRFIQLLNRMGLA
ncbi:MAG: protein kinase [Acidobacteriota bacterium]|nr:protein kinase [Blastocatellia bacterium]MDW8239394.1 protein kinase [Acidobacteriota bacterium]